MASLFDRRCAVTIGPLRFESHPSPTTDYVPGFHITFSVTRSTDSKANKAQCTISNLSRTSQAKISALKKPPFTIEAGYLGSFGQIFSGNAVEVSHEKKDAGFETKIASLDGVSSLRVRMNKSLGPGAKSADVLAEISKAMGIPTTGTWGEKAKAFANGIVLANEAHEELDKLAKSLGVRWSIQSGQLQLLDTGKVLPGGAVLLSAKTGLIATPTRVYDKKKKRLIVKARALCQPLLDPGRAVRFESFEISGQFAIETVTHKGDSSAGDYVSEIETVELK